MTDLIKRLHHHANGDCDMTPVCSTLLEAADRIEQLERELNKLREPFSTLSTLLGETEIQLEEANAKLAKAVEALREIAKAYGIKWHAGVLSRAALAELGVGE